MNKLLIKAVLLILDSQFIAVVEKKKFDQSAIVHHRGKEVLMNLRTFSDITLNCCFLSFAYFSAYCGSVESYQLVSKK